MKHERVIMMAAALAVAVLGGSLVGHRMGMNFSKEWSTKDYSIATQNQYQSIIEQNILKLHAADAIPAYKEMPGYIINGQIIAHQSGELHNSLTFGNTFHSLLQRINSTTR